MESALQTGLVVILIGATWRAGEILQGVREDYLKGLAEMRAYVEDKYVGKDFLEQSLGRLGDRVAAQETATREMKDELARFREVFQGRNEVGTLDK